MPPIPVYLTSYTFKDYTEGHYTNYYGFLGGLDRCNDSKTGTYGTGAGLGSRNVGS